MQNKDVWKLLPHHLSDLGDAAHQGEEVVLMRDGQPWLRLTPCPDYTPPPLKSRAERAVEYPGKRGRPAVPYPGSPNPLNKPWALFPERELCAECLAKYRADGRADDPKDAAPEPAAAKGGG